MGITKSLLCKSLSIIFFNMEFRHFVFQMIQLNRNLGSTGFLESATTKSADKSHGNPGASVKLIGRFDRSLMFSLIDGFLRTASYLCELNRAPRLLDESTAATKRINFSPSSRSTYFAFSIVVSANSFLSLSSFIRSHFRAETTQLHSSTSRRATYTRICAWRARLYASGRK